MRLYISLLLFLLAGPNIFGRGITILVHPMQNTGDAKYSWLNAGITATVISDLSKIKDISVVSEAERKKVLKEVEFAMSGLVDDEKIVKVGKLLGANLIFSGSYLVIDGQVRVNAHLISVEKGSIEKSVKIDGTLSKLFDLQDRIAFSLMAETEKIRLVDISPVKFTHEDRESIRKEARPSLNAYELYARGLEVQRVDAQEAMAYFRQSLKIDPGYLDALREAAQTASKSLGLFDEALGYLDRTEKIIGKKAGKNSAQYASLMNSIAIVYHDKGNFAKAVTYYARSKETYDKLKLHETPGYSNLLNNLGIVWRHQGDLARAISFYTESKKIRDRLGLQKTAGYAELMNNAGVAFQEKGENQNAIKGFSRSKETYEAIGLVKTAGYASLMNNIALVYKAQGELADALDFHLKSKTGFEELSLQRTVAYANVLYNTAIVCEKLNRNPEARAYFGQAYSTYAQLGRKSDAEDARKNAERLK